MNISEYACFKFMENKRGKSLLFFEKFIQGLIRACFKTITDYCIVSLIFSLIATLLIDCNKYI